MSNHVTKGSILTIHPQKCVSCRTCELVCSFTKTERCNPKDARIRVVMFDEEGFYSPTVCFQCQEAWCAQACPASAITRNEETGAFVVDEARCVGCRMCTVVCPFGQIFISKSKGKASKCDLCDGDPACVRFCPTEAIKFEKIDSSQADRRKAMMKKVMVAAQAEE
jgi:anaerobic carbon-monoxide dehydrogenase iron sulfur subunit